MVVDFRHWAGEANPENPNEVDLKSWLQWEGHIFLVKSLAICKI